MPEATPPGWAKGARKLAEQAPAFQPLVQRHGDPVVRTGRETFEALVAAITSQQLSVKAAATILSRVEDLCDGTLSPERLLAATPDELRGCGLSRPKAGYLHGLAEQLTSGALNLEDLGTLDDEEVVDRLTSIKGIGAWSAHMILIFDLHRPDILAHGDLGVQDATRMVLGLEDRPSPGELQALAEPWRPYRSIACWYLWTERDARLQAQGKR